MAQDLGERHDLDSISLIQDGLGIAAGRPLHRIARAAQKRMASCHGVGVVVAENGVMVNVAHTTDAARRLDWIQSEIGNGPGLEAIRQLQVFNVPHLSSAAPWAEFGRVAQGLGVSSGLFVPIIEGGRAFGAMSFYSEDADAFSGQERLGLSFSSEAAKAMAATDKAS